MKYITIILGMALAVCAWQNASAQEKPIPDMSLTPEETLQQPNIIHNGNGSMPGSYQPYNGINTSDDPVQQRIDNSAGVPGGMADGTVAANSFMGNYCGQNPPLLGNNAMQSCLETQRQQACGLYANLPYDARQVLSQAIDCEATFNDSETAAPSANNNCSANDTMRITMLKKYWKDPTTSQALIFLPDQVLDAPALCAKGVK